ncbi:MAG: hydrogen gas-evolving membrane-bound hydrogenase subunit E [Ilumatobacteraceae bacterium]
MAGIPATLGFVSKEAAFEAFAHGGISGAGLVLALLVAASCITAAYSIRYVWGAFTAGGTDWKGAPPPATSDDAPAGAFWGPPAVLASATLLLGVAPFLVDPLTGAAASALAPGSEPAHLAVWHGFTVALALSAVVLAVGTVMFIARKPIAEVLALGRRLPSGTDVYLAMLRGLNSLADRVTGALQNGSLPFYAAVILVTASVGPGVVLARSGDWAGWPEVLDTPAHLPVVAGLVGGAIGAALVRRRLAAVVFLSLVGYGMAGLFVVEGAPDLALTQVTVETLSTVVFVLVLRRLPPRFSEPSAGQVVRVAVSALVGIVVFLFALMAAANRTAPPVSDEMIERALPEGGGKNVVNVILVDFRGFDTLGEITVLAVAAVGAVALARATLGGRPRQPSAAGDDRSTAARQP